MGNGPEYQSRLCFTPAWIQAIPGCSAVWLAHLTGGQKVGGSNPLTPIFKRSSPSTCSSKGFFVVRIRSAANYQKNLYTAQEFGYSSEAIVVWGPRDG